MSNTIATIKENKELNGIEIYFVVYPISGTRETLKKNGFRWNHKKACWYAKDGMTTRSIADAMADTTIDEYKRIAENAGESVNEVKSSKVDSNKADDKKAVKKAVKAVKKANKYGIQVGDYFSMSWGYDQTNVDYFQVVELVGECSVRVRDVRPEIVEESYEGYNGMAVDRVYKCDRSKLATPSPFSVFVDDQDKGDLHRVSKGYNGHLYIAFKGGHYHAYKVESETEKQYESWYH